MKTPRQPATPATPPAAPAVPAAPAAPAPIPARAVAPPMTPDQRVEQARREIGRVLEQLGCEFRTTIQKRAFQPAGDVMLYADEVVLTIVPR